MEVPRNQLGCSAEVRERDYAGSASCSRHVAERDVTGPPSRSDSRRRQPVPRKNATPTCRGSVHRNSQGPLSAIRPHCIAEAPPREGVSTPPSAPLVCLGVRSGPWEFARFGGGLVRRCVHFRPPLRCAVHADVLFLAPVGGPVKCIELRWLREPGTGTRHDGTGRAESAGEHRANTAGRRFRERAVRRARSFLRPSSRAPDPAW